MSVLANIYKKLFALASHTHTKSQITDFPEILPGIPSGAIMWFYLSEAPTGWIVCDGTNGTPNLIGKYALGASSNIGNEVAAGLPAFDGTFSVTGGSHYHKMHGTASSGTGSIGVPTAAGAWQCATGEDFHDSGVAGHVHDISVTYPEGSIFGSSDTVTPPSVKLLPCMKL